ncbi:hypothetical protein [Larkinella soli]|uniref:hypothetical protein n=1 Tax=Larkinella soli TaxID=1770527 RepID=UPI000FFC6CB0|nr:hypothetical protein [Larkinella soli]
MSLFVSRPQLAGRFFALFVLHVLVFAGVNAVLPAFSPSLGTLPPEEAARLPVLSMVYLAVRTAVLTFLILNAGASGLRLAALLVAVLFYFETFMLQLEPLWFHTAFPALTPRNVGLIALSSFLEKVLIIPAAVFLLKKGKAPAVGRPVLPPPVFHLSAFFALPLLYVLIYFSFGYFVAWQSPEVRQFYSGSTGLLPFLTHIEGIKPSFLLFQYGRGIGWLLGAMGMALLYAGRRQTFLISMMLVCSVLISVPLILPNPLMPVPVRMAHIPEMVLSMAVWSFFLVRFAYRPGWDELSRAH